MSVKKCVIRGCATWRTEDTKYMFYYFPKTEDRRQLWMESCRVAKSSHNTLICSKHFSPDSFKDDPGHSEKRQLRKWAIPNQELDGGGQCKEDQTSFLIRYGDYHPEGQSNDVPLSAEAPLSVETPLSAEAPLPVDGLLEQLIDPGVAVDMDIDLIEETIEEEGDQEEDSEEEEKEVVIDEQIKSKCRLCFNVPLDDNVVVNLFDENGSLLKDLVIFFQVQFKDSSEWPTIVCNTCVDFINQIKTFQSQILTAHSKFYKEIVRSKGIPKGKEIAKSKKNPRPQKTVKPLAPGTQKEGGVKCKFCDVRFCAKNRTYTRHLNSFHKESNLQCETCGKVWANHTKLYFHRLTHLPKSEQPYKCPHCDKRFAASGNLTVHIQRIHDAKLRYICDQCGQGFTNKGSMWDHRKIKHSEYVEKRRPGKAGSKGKPCEICGFKFLNMTTHMRFSHGTGKKRAAATVYEENEEVKCPVETCGKIMNRFDMRQHSREHGEGLYCEICLIRIKGGGKAAAHMDKHRGASYPCGHCDKEYDNSQGLYLHIKSKHVEVYMKNIKRAKVE